MCSKITLTFDNSSMQSQNVKVRAGRKKKSLTLDRRAYEKGVVDSKQIDLNQQALRE